MKQNAELQTISKWSWNHSAHMNWIFSRLWQKETVQWHNAYARKLNQKGNMEKWKGLALHDSKTSMADIYAMQTLYEKKWARTRSGLFETIPAKKHKRNHNHSIYLIFECSIIKPYYVGSCSAVPLNSNGKRYGKVFAATFFMSCHNTEKGQKVEYCRAIMCQR